MKEYTIDAKGRSLGRVASEAAIVLRGKNMADFKANAVPIAKLTVINADQIKLTGQKSKQKEYKSYSGYPGSLRFMPIEKEMERKGKAFILKKAILGMLPKNKLCAKIIKNLTIK